LLYGYVRQYTNLDEAGWAQVWADRARLARERGVDRRTLHRHLRDLERLGVLRRDPEQRTSGKISPLWMRPIEGVLAHLAKLPAAQETLRERFPEADDPQVLPFIRSPLAVTVSRSREDDPDMDAWMTERHTQFAEQLMHTNPLFAVRDVAKDVHEERQEAATVRRAANRRPASNAPKAPERTDTAPALLRFLDALNTANFPNATRTALTGENLGKMRKLLDIHGEKDVRGLIEFCASPAGWARVKKQFPRIEIWQPTPGLLLAWNESLMQWVKAGAPDNPPKQKSTTGWNAKGPKRSGGATPYARPSVDAEGFDTF
jgi:hypothetical protein